MPIFYGSQTGTAFGFAKKLGQEVIRYGGKSKVIDLATFDVAALLKEKLVVFIVATYGAGGPTDNARKFYDWIKSSANSTSDFLSNLKFAVFGCGDKLYRNYNRMAKTVTEGLLSRGATKICETGIGNASDDIEGDFAQWKKQLWRILDSSVKETKEENNATVIFDTKEMESVDFSKIEFDLTTKQYIDSSKA